jgi:hypothetical protein
MKKNPGLLKSVLKLGFWAYMNYICKLKILKYFTMHPNNCTKNPIWYYGPGRPPSSWYAFERAYGMHH